MRAEKISVIKQRNEQNYLEKVKYKMEEEAILK